MPSARSQDDTVLFSETQRAFLALRLVTEVRPDGLYVRLGPLQQSFHRVPAADIASATVEPYSAADHGGWHWGVRTSVGGDRTVYRVSGREGVTVRRTDGSALFVGSDRPAALTEAVRKVSDGSAD